MKLRELLEAIDALGLDMDSEVVISNPQSCSSDFILEVCDYEHEDGGVGKGPDDGGWGGPKHNPRPLQKPVLSLDTSSSEPRVPITFK